MMAHFRTLIRPRPAPTLVPGANFGRALVGGNNRGAVPGLTRDLVSNLAEEAPDRVRGKVTL